MHRLTTLLPLFLALVAPAAQAASLLVTNSNDVGAGSLRQAVEDYAPGDTIRFAPGLTGTITNQGDPWQFTRPVTVAGPGADVLAVSGGDLRPLFIVANCEVHISGLTLRNARSPYGAAIASNDTLRLTRCTFRANRATGGGGAVRASGGVLEVTECTFENNVAELGTGGAIQTSAYSTIQGSTFRANSGSAVEASATLFLVNSTFSGNSNDVGGAVRLYGNPQIVFNCTISGNSASSQGGGVYVAPGSLPQFMNTIVAGNTGPHPDVSGLVYSSEFSLIGDATGSSGFGAPGSHDQVGAVGNPLDPNLAPLGNYGGPTWTMPPRPGSPAVDQGRSPYPFDQRGRARFHDQPLVLNVAGGDGSDVGAYELRPSLRTVTHRADTGEGSLRQAVADLHPYDADSVKFAANVKGTITLFSGPIVCTKPGVIDGPNSWDLTIHGNNAGRLFQVNQNVAFDFLDLTLTGGREFDGIAVLAAGNTTLRNCRLVGNHLQPSEFSFGGVVREVPPATLQLENCTVANNTTGFGGGVFSGLGVGAGGTAIVANCTFSGNSGPGVVSSGTTTIVFNSTFTNNNTAGQDGGGIWHLQGPAIVLGSTILAGNLGPADVAGAFASQGYNLIGKVGAASGLAHGVNHDRVGTAASPIAPGLGPLLANGGPGETHAVLPGSPALDKGILFRLLDQRGAARYDDPSVANEADGSDIGAYERNPNSPVAVDPLPPEASLFLASPRPNPAAGGVIAFHSRLGSAGAVTLGIFDVAGRRVRDLVSATRPAGSYTDAWDGRDDAGRTVPAGVYFARLVAAGHTVRRNFVVLP
jgi:predicted outer membrane repeat protein